MTNKPDSVVSRRALLGTLAAAPVVGPAIAKEVIAPVSSASFYRDQLSAMEISSIESGKWYFEIPSWLPAASSGVDEFPPAAPDRYWDPSICDGNQLAAPNRLFGSYINEEGEAC